MLRRGRKWIALLFAGISCLSLAACGEGGRNSGSGGKTGATQINIWIQSVNQPDYFMGWFEKEFETENPDIDLNFIPQASSVLSTSLDVSLAGNNAPDMAVTWGGTILPTLAAGNRVTDISDIMADKEDDMINLALLNKVDGKHYGAPIFGFANVIYYNKTVFDSLGIEPPENYNEWKEISATIRAEKDNRGRSVYQPLTTAYAYHLMQSIHGRTMTEAQLNALIQPYSADVPNPFDNDGFRNGFSWVAQMAGDGIFADGITGMDISGAQDNFVQQKSLMISGPSIDLLALSANCQFEIGTFLMPDPPAQYAAAETPTSKVAGIYTDVLCINAKSEHQDECKKVIEYLYTEKAQEKLLDFFMMPVLKNVGTDNVSSTVRQTFDTAFKPFYDEVNQHGMTVYYMNYFPKAGIDSLLNDAFKGIVNESGDRFATAIALADQFQAKWN